jgi:hypothetical protein
MMLMSKLLPTRLCGAVAAALMLLPALAQADLPVTYKDGARALFSVSAPDFWTVRAGGARELAAPGDDAREVARVMAMYPASEPRVWVGFVVPTGVRDFDQAAEYLRDIGPFLVKNAQVSSRKSMRVGGLPARTIAGNGSRKGKAVNFTAVLIDLPNGRMAISVVVLEAGVDAAITADVNAIFASFRAR